VAYITVSAADCNTTDLKCRLNWGQAGCGQSPVAAA